jgi:hemolysin D
MAAEALRRAFAVAGEAIRSEREAGAALRRHRDEVEFLPAALEVMETPISPAGRALAWALMGLFAIALAWSIIGEVDVVASAQGKIVPTGRTKVVQPLEAGVVRAIDVEDGQRVTAGQPLIELDPTQTAADETNLTQQLITNQVEAARWAALVVADPAAFTPPPSPRPPRPRPPW